MLNDLTNHIAFILNRFDTESVELLRKYNKDSGQYTTGKTSDLFSSNEVIEESIVKGFVFGAGYIDSLNEGIKPGTAVPITTLVNWIENKNKFSLSFKETNSFALNIRNKIFREGSYQYRMGGQTYGGMKNPISKAFEATRIAKLQKDLALGIMPVITSEVLTQFKKQ